MITRRTILQMTAAAVVVGSLAAPVGARAETAPLALKGYDPVAYFTDAKPMPGVEQYELTWDGQRYRFTSAQHRDLFKANPDKYAPQFGGLCAMNLSVGVKRESDPHNWVISNGNLYVFAGERGVQNFTQNPDEMAAKAAKAAANLKTLKALATQ